MNQQESDPEKELYEDEVMSWKEGRLRVKEGFLDEKTIEEMRKAKARKVLSQQREITDKSVIKIIIDIGKRKHKHARIISSTLGFGPSDAKYPADIADLVEDRINKLVPRLAKKIKNLINKEFKEELSESHTESRKIYQISSGNSGNTGKVRKRPWTSSLALRSALKEAVEAIERRKHGWRRPNSKDTCYKKADVNAVLAYFGHQKSRYRDTINISSKDSFTDWLKKKDLPKWPTLRRELREEIRREKEMIQKLPIEVSKKTSPSRKESADK